MPLAAIWSNDHRPTVHTRKQRRLHSRRTHPSTAGNGAHEGYIILNSKQHDILVLVNSISSTPQLTRQYVTPDQLPNVPW